MVFINWLLRYLLLSVIFLAIPFKISATNYYVSPTGSNGDALSWSTAWNNFSSINWGSVQPGDVINLDGGSTACPSFGSELHGTHNNCGKVYNQTLSIGKSGTSDSNRVTIRLSTEPNRNGTVIIDGGVTSWGRSANGSYRTEGLKTGANATPFYPCTADYQNTEPDWVRSGGSRISTGINFNNHNYVSVDGTKWGGIVIRNTLTRGVDLGHSQGAAISYLKIHHIADPSLEYRHGDDQNHLDPFRSERSIDLGHNANNTHIQFVEMFRAGQDALRLSGDNVTISNNYIHHYYCAHPDGIQALVYTSNSGVGTSEQKVENYVIEKNIWESVGLQSVFFGENNSHQSWASNWQIRDNIFASGGTFVRSKHASTTNITVEFNTFHNSSSGGMQWVTNATAPMTVRNNIFTSINSGGWGFAFPTTNGSTSFSQNCTYQIGSLSGQVSRSNETSGNPNFANPSNLDFNLGSGSACNSSTHGARAFQSFNEFIALGNGTPGPSLTPGPSPTPTHTPTPTAAPPPGCFTSNTTSWVSQTFTTQTGTFTYQFDATPNGTNIDGVMGLSTTPVTAFSTLSAIVRFNAQGFIDAYHGSAASPGYQAHSSIPYVANQTYHFRFVVDIANQRYSAYVTPNGSSELTIATNFGFRTLATNLSFFNTFNVSGSQLICNNTLGILPGDFDQNGNRDFADFRLFLTNFNSTNSLYNFVSPSLINIFDYNAFIRLW